MSSVHIPTEVRDYLQRYHENPLEGCERLIRTSVLKDGREMVAYSLSHPIYQFFSRICCCCCTSMQTLRGERVIPFLESDIDRLHALKSRFKSAVHQVIAAGIGRGLDEIQKQGFNGCTVREEHWSEIINPDHFGPLLERKLFHKWERSQTSLSYLSWLESPDGIRAREDVLDSLRGYFDYRSSEKEIHPITQVLVHKTDIDKLKIKYVSDEERKTYAVQFRTNLEGETLLYSSEGTPIVGTFAYVIGPDKTIYAAPHKPNQFHHSSFLRGTAVIGAGKFTTDSNGKILALDNNSGHYRPSRANFEDTLRIFKENGVDLDKVEISFKTSFV
jgi:hypothetical protein